MFVPILNFLLIAALNFTLQQIAIFNIKTGVNVW